MTREELEEKIIYWENLHQLDIDIGEVINTFEDVLKLKDERIAELEEAQLTRKEWYQKGYAEAMKHKECCLICKDRSGCKFADNVRETFGINSNEMWFSCFKTKDIK